MSVSHQIDSFSGISTQPDHIRFDSQVDDMINFYPTADGKTIKRGGMSYFDDVSTGNAKLYTYSRGDGEEKYKVILQGNGTIQIWLITEPGGELTFTPDFVFRSDAYSATIATYLTSSNPDHDFKLVTVGDVTWILNKSINTAMTASTTSDNGNIGYIWIKKISPDDLFPFTYNVSFTGATGGTYSFTPTSGNSENLTTCISANLQELINAGTGTHGVTAAVLGGDDGGTAPAIYGKSSVIKLIGTDANLTGMSYSDSFGDLAGSVFYKKINALEDLPPTLFGETTSSTIEINSGDDLKGDSYYVKWTGKVWEETTADGIENKIDINTMPLLMARQPGGYFTLSFIEDHEGGTMATHDINPPYTVKAAATTDGFKFDIENRLVGDDDSNKLPSFIDEKIRDMFFFKNRLGFITTNAVVMSEIGKYGNFFFSTVLQLLGSDPIDVIVDTTYVTYLHYAIPLNNELFLFSEDSQLTLSGQGALTPSTVRISESTRYSFDSNVQPLVVGDTVYFAVRKDTGSALMKYTSYGQMKTNTGEDVSSHVSGLIPYGMKFLVGSSALKMIFIGGIDNIVYGYRYETQGDDLVLTAWFKFQFNPNINIVNSVWFDDVMYLLDDTGEYYYIPYNGSSVDYRTDDENSDLSTYDFEARVDLSSYSPQTQTKTKSKRGVFQYKTIQIMHDEDVNNFYIEMYRRDLETITTEWVTITDYVVSDLRIDSVDGNLYRCIVAHTSGAVTPLVNAAPSAESTPWFSGVDYVIGEFRIDETDIDGRLYKCIANHTSASTTPKDDAVNWILVTWISYVDPLEATKVIVKREFLTRRAYLSGNNKNRKVSLVSDTAGDCTLYGVNIEGIYIERSKGI